MNGIYAIVYLVKQHTCFLHQFGTVLLDSFAPYKGVLVCLGLYLCTIHILDIKCHKSFFCKNEDELREDFVDFVFHTITETIDSYEVWLLISCQPNKMDIPRKQLFYLATRIDVVHVGINNNLEHHFEALAWESQGFVSFWEF